MADYEVTVTEVLVGPDGAMQNLVVFYDGESFFSRLSPLENIARMSPQTKIPTLYSYADWLTCMTATPSGMLVCGDASGAVHRQTPQGWIVDKLSRGPVKGVLGHAGSLYAACGDGSILSFYNDHWESLGQGLSDEPTRMACDGDGTLLVTGENGLASIWSGDSWTPMNIPTRATIYGGLSPAPGTWLLCGAGGLLLRGGVGSWEQIPTDLPDLGGLVEYAGETWIACGTAGVGVLRDGDRVEIVRDTFAARHLSAAGAYISFCGNDLAVRFDGSNWNGWRYS